MKIDRRHVLRASTGAAIALLSACNREKKKIVGVVPKGSSHLFWQSVHAGAVKAGRERNLDIAWNGPSTETDYNGQIQIVDSMINRHVDAIALAPIDKKVMVNVVERAVQSGIPVIIFDSPIDTPVFTSQVATDNYAAGEMAAKRMGELLGGKGKVVIVAVQPGGASTMARESGFEDRLKKDSPGIQIVDKRYGMADVAKSLQVAENMLTAFPDVNGLFASNESSAVGAAQALKARNLKNVKMVGFDWGPTLEEGLKNGEIDSLVTQDPFGMGYHAVLDAYAKIMGQPVEKIRNMPPMLVTTDNLASKDVQERVNPDLKKYLN